MENHGLQGTGLIRRVTSNYWYPTREINSGTSTFTQNTLYAVPLWIERRVTLNAVAIECTTLAASNVFRIGIYNSDGGGLPTTLLSELGTVAGTGAGMKTITGLSVALTGQLYWLAGVNQTSAAQWRASTIGLPYIGDSASTPAGTNPCAYTCTGVTGALGTFGTIGVAASGPGFFVRFN